MKRPIPLLALVLILAGCSTRSISNSGYSPSHAWGRSENSLYKGELTEVDILGAATQQEIKAESIEHALKTATPPQLKRGDKVILIQSGASVPDNAMMEEASRYFSVASFSGIPPEEKSGLSESLRLRAAQGGYRYVVCYWGVLESAQQDKEGKVVAWVPIVGAFIPDQKQQMRIRLKAILLDVASRGWKMFTPEARSDAHYNSGWSRESTDQKLVQSLKERGYHDLIKDLLRD